MDIETHSAPIFAEYRKQERVLTADCERDPGLFLVGPQASSEGGQVFILGSIDDKDTRRCWQAFQWNKMVLVKLDMIHYVA